MKIKKSQLEQLIKVATLDILRELQSRAEEAGVETETANPPSPPIGPPMSEGKHNESPITKMANSDKRHQTNKNMFKGNSSKFKFSSKEKEAERLADKKQGDKKPQGIDWNN